MRHFVVASVLVGLMPLAAEAAVTINEIAWMGDSTSPNHEWIELYNDSDAVNLDGWTLTDGDSLNIALSGTISANEYAVLERTSDDSASGSAFLIYTGALKNTGITLTLKRADGSTEDRVAGGDNWENLGGDNETKDTAQYTTSGWITAEPTPGFANTNPPVQNTKPSTSSGSSGSARLAEPVVREGEELKLPGITLELDLIAPKQVFVNQAVSFEVIPSGVGETIENSLNYTWNFGDTNVSNHKNPTHVFTYPGTYVVHVYAEYARQHASAMKEITVLPVALSLTKNSAGDIQINNDSPYKINLSDYRLRAGEVLEIPPNTWLLPRQTITINSTKVAANEYQLAALYDGVGELVTSLMPEYLVTRTVTEPMPYAAPVVAAPSNLPRTQTFQFVSDTQANEKETEEAEPVPDEILEETEIVSQTDGSESFDWTIIALVVLLSVGCIVVLMKPMSETKSLNKHE